MSYFIFICFSFIIKNAYPITPRANSAITTQSLEAEPYSRSRECLSWSPQSSLYDCVRLSCASCLPSPSHLWARGEYVWIPQQASSLNRYHIYNLTRQALIGMDKLNCSWHIRVEPSKLPQFLHIWFIVDALIRYWNAKLQHLHTLLRENTLRLDSPAFLRSPYISISLLNSWFILMTKLS